MIKRLAVKKGSRLYIEGKLIPDKETGGPRAWISTAAETDGMAQSTFVIWADTVIVLDAKKAESPSQ